jgi:hypothetical protein
MQILWVALCGLKHGALHDGQLAPHVDSRRRAWRRPCRHRFPWRPDRIRCHAGPKSVLGRSSLGDPSLAHAVA